MPRIPREQRNWMTVREVAEYLELHPDTVRRWCAVGVLGAYREGPYRSPWKINAELFEETMYQWFDDHNLKIRERRYSGNCKRDRNRFRVLDTLVKTKIDGDAR